MRGRETGLFILEEIKMICNKCLSNMTFNATADYGQYQCPKCGNWRDEYGESKRVAERKAAILHSLEPRL
jgi:transcription initiation factor IIE alpha subunit